MTHSARFDVIIIGGSYAGLSAALALGRSLRQVLIIDSGTPCNRQTPHSHNFLTQDGKTPQEISSLAWEQVAQYETVQFYQGFATKGEKIDAGFEIQTQSGDTFRSAKLIVATGIKDLMPDIPGFAACWGISVIHCPYCHGYEVRNEPTAILGNGEYGFEFSKMILHWTKDLRLFTNGPSSLTAEQTQLLAKHHVNIVETEVERLSHTKGQIDQVVFKDGTATSVKAVYAKVPFVQHTDIPQTLGCELDEGGYIQVNPFQQTNIPGIYACGDNTTPMRSVSHAVAMGTAAGAMLNKELIDESF